MPTTDKSSARLRSWRHRLGPVGLLAALFTSLVTAGGAQPAHASVTPASGTLTITAGNSATETKTVGVPATPPKADIELAIDTTGSMQPSINQAKADAVNLVNQVQSQVPDTQFAVVQFKDFCTTTPPTSGPGCTFPTSTFAGDYPEYSVQQALTGSSSAVASAINSLSANGGGDAPEAHNVVFHNSYDPSVGGPIGWRSGTRKFVVVISDAEPHGARSAGFTSCADTSPDPHGLNTATELAGMRVAERTLIMIRQVSPFTTTSLACYQQLAAAGFTGGAAADAGASLGSQIVGLINAAFANVNDVHLEVASASPGPANTSWISFAPASVGPVPAPSTQTFTLTAAVPSTTPSGTYNFDIVALADGVDIGHQALTIVVNRPATLTYDGVTTADYHDTATLSATLRDGVSGDPLSGDPVDFTLGSQSCSGVTDTAGHASCTLTPEQPAGPYTVNASFAGTPQYLAASVSAPFTITKEETSISYTGPTVVANGQPTTLSGVLTEDGTTPIAGRSVTLTLGSGSTAQACSGTTDASGTASCTLTPAQPLGPGTVSADFAGDAFYLPASAHADTILFAFLDHGSFVVGDANAISGSAVTWWGAQWSKANALSGGAAPSAFKGFASGAAAPPACGGTWTTGPGNSSDPPASVPSYMGVIVASHATQAGSTLSGDVAAIVVVKTDPGYEANPGHAGTGTVVAVFCGRH